MQKIKMILNLNFINTQCSGEIGDGGKKSFFKEILYKRFKQKKQLSNSL